MQQEFSRLAGAVEQDGAFKRGRWLPRIRYAHRKNRIVKANPRWSAE
jgi:hypothetical protein